MTRDAPPIAAGLFLVGSGLFSSPRVSAVSKQINAAPYRFSATDSCRCHVEASLIVSSLRPSFPLLRRSPPIPSLPWLLAADLFRSRSAQVEALPCHSVASRCAWIPVPSLLRRLTGGRFQAVLFHLRSCRSVSPRLHAFSSLIFSAPRLVLSEQLCSIPWPFASSRVHSLPYRCRSHQFASAPCRFGSSRLPSPPCRCYSRRFPSQLLGSTLRHLSTGQVRALQFHLHSVACQLISVCTVHGHSLACRIGSVLG